jgi:tRNA nucleotidyltransferase/poly(A) polymerase
MDERLLAEAAGEEAYLVGGAVRDELLGREVVDVDVAAREPERAARAYRRAAGGTVFPLSERHGAWRVAYRDGRTVDFTPLRDGIEDDLRSRDFTVNAVARPLGSREHVDPLGGREDLDARVLRAVSDAVFADDPLRLLRAARLEDELGFRLDPATEQLVRRDAALVTRPAGERILGELVRLSADGWRRLAELGLLGPLGGSLERLGRAGPADHPDYLLVVCLGEAALALPVSNETRRFAARLLAATPPEDDSPRAIHRFRRATEPWALEALAFLGAGNHADAVRAARERDPAEPLLRGHELGIPDGPEVGRLLDAVEEERAAGTISTRDEALALVARLREKS